MSIYKIHMYTKENCANCVTAKKTLKENNIPTDYTLLETAADISNFKTVYPTVTAMPFFELLENGKISSTFFNRDLKNILAEYFTNTQSSTK